MVCKNRGGAREHLAEHLSQQRSKEEQNELYTHVGTSKSAEGVGLTELFGEAFKEGMEISTHVQDFDSSKLNLLSLREHFLINHSVMALNCTR